MAGTQAPGSPVPVDEALRGLDRYDAVIDTRSPAEFADDHIPGALNLPVLDDAERALVGTIYARQSPFEARKIGAALVARNIARHIETQLRDRPKSWRPLVYCWRGGMRSGAMTTVLAQIGFPARQLEGGYRAFRRRVIVDLERLPAALSFVVLHGPTGSGKTALLEALDEAGAQALDLEALAAHRGSVLGGFAADGVAQPAQRAFESALWQKLRGFERVRPVFVESESRRIGRLSLPGPLFEAMTGSSCVRVAAPLEARVGHLVARYGDLYRDVGSLQRRLGFFVELHGRKTVDRWRQWAEEGRLDDLAREMVRCHYDPAYERGSHCAYRRAPRARVLELPALDPESIARGARALVESATVPGTADA